MLRSMNDLKDYTIRATDGIIGRVKDFYFDDAAWVIRYIVVDTGTWLSSRKVLISPVAMGLPDWTEKTLPVSITKEQIKNSPEIDSDKPVSRQHEIRYLGYYGYPFYWGGGGLWGAGTYPNMIMPDYSTPLDVQTDIEKIYAKAEAAQHEHDDHHLRSANEVTGYHIHVNDGEIGHVQDLLFDEKTWAVRYLVVNTSNWWIGHKVLIAPEWIEEVRWSDSTVSVNLTRQAVQDAPLYDSAALLDRDKEISIHQHYQRKGYWED